MLCSHTLAPGGPRLLRIGDREDVGWVMVADERENDAPAAVCVVTMFVVVDVDEEPARVAADNACCSPVTRRLFLPVD